MRITLYFFLSFSFAGIFASNQTIQYLFPVPGSSHVPAGSEILVRFQNTTPSQIINLESFIEVTGEKSGAVSGETTILTDQKTVRFIPDQPFIAGERVTLQICPLLEGTNKAFPNKTCHFTIYAQPETLKQSVMPKNLPGQKPVFDYSVNRLMAQDPFILNGISIPSNFPKLKILLNNNPANGYIFITHGWGSQINYYMILDSTGAPVWYNCFIGWIMPQTLNLQKNGEITFNVPVSESSAGVYISMDNTYTVNHLHRIDWNGYIQNDHELVITENGQSFMIGVKDYDIDLSQYIPGAGTNVKVEETAIFGYPADSKTPNFIWRAFDHFDIEDTDEPELDEINSHYLRFPHMNAIDIDTDGHILLSSRHLSEITKINIETGEIIWRLGGKNNQFTFINDPLNGPSCQHDIRSLGNHCYTVFDNGNLHNPPISRGVEWELDTTAMNATLVWEYRNTEASPKYSNFMGNNQRLLNGNRWINWAYSHDQFRLVTEVTPEGNKAFEFMFEDNSSVYRIFKYQWDAIAKVPYLVIEVYTDAVTLIFNKFGDSEVDYYNIYGGTRKNPDTIIATSDKPFIHLTHELVNNRRNYFRVTAVNKNGQESGFSNQEDVLVNLIEPGENLVSNGDFEHGFDGWEWWPGNAVAFYEITEEHQLHIMIQDGGSTERDIRVLHPGLSLINGQQYRFEFDAYATQNRVIFIDIQNDDDIMTNFSKIGGTPLTPNQKHFSYEFIMEEPSEKEAQIILDAGGYDYDIYIDNVSLKQVELSKTEQVEFLQNTYKLQQNYPNPFNPSTEIKYSLQKSSHVLLKIYNISGQELETLINEFQRDGEHKIMWQPKGLASGIYFYRLQVGELSETKKLILQK